VAFRGKSRVVKLAFWDTVNGAYRYVFAHPLTVLRAGWAYLLVDAVSLFLHKAAVPASEMILAAIVVTVLLVAASIAWHIALVRAILLDEHAWSAAVQFRHRHWRMLGVGVLLFLMLAPATGVAVLAGIFAIHAGWPAAAGGVLVIPIAVVAAIMLASRLYLLAPAVAIDDPAKAIGAAWRRGRRNTLRLFFGGLLMVVPATVVLAIVGGSVGLLLFFAVGGGVPVDEWLAQLSLASRAALGLGQAILQIFVGALNIAFYAFAYRQLAPNWNPPPALAALQLDT
jgi:hypothetical protein